MKILGIKLTHDAAVAAIEDGRLKFCVEIEKIGNNPRYSKMWSNNYIHDIMVQENFNPKVFVVDGWKGALATGTGHEDELIKVESYHEFDQWAGPHGMRGFHAQGGLRIGAFDFPYHSFKHIYGHIFGAYVTAPWSAAREPCYSITWDGGMQPRIHHIDPATGKVEFVDTVHELYSFIYGAMGRYFGPFKFEGIESIAIEDLDDLQRAGGYEIPGKLMSYIACGNVHEGLFYHLMSSYHSRFTIKSEHDHLHYDQSGENEHYMLRRAFTFAFKHDISDEDSLRTIHEFLEVMLVENATRKIPHGHNLIFVGGSALNIKWNSALRRSGHFKALWIPPFPNDSGSAIGQAAAYMALMKNHWTLDWSVYAGPRLQLGAVPEGWRQAACSVADLAHLLWTTDEPVLVMNGRAEVGPRALGNRSIMMSPASPYGKDKLNAIKNREAFRPVAPIALEEDAPEFFEPGTPDPYMLFDHRVKRLTNELMPAVVHLDGTARLQTVNASQNAIVYELLNEFKKFSGYGVLCNTSANLNGAGFFPSIGDALEWGQVKYLWNGGTLYTKED